jgi:hypothetical protein
MLCPEDAFYNIEYNFFIKNEKFLNKNNLFYRYKKRLELIEKYSINQSWEKEDVKYWDSKYNQRSIISASEIKPALKIGGIRLYRRNKYFFNKIKEILKQKNITLLEIGCGEGDTVLNCLNPYYYNYYYIASDYSFNALLYLQNIYKGLNNVQLIQCSGSKLPFADNAIDAIVGLGILHHMPKKEEELKNIIPKISQHGYFMTFEAFVKDSKLPSVFKNIYDKWIEPDKSAHEERIDLKNFIRISNQLGKLEFIKYEHTPLLTVLNKIFGKYINNNLVLTKLLFILDDMVIYSIGKIIRLFKPGACYAIIKKAGFL